MIGWYDLIAPATFEVRCGGATHRVTWRDGRVELDDHDLAAERTMLALGGERCLCLDVEDLWHHVDEDWPALRTVLSGRASRPSTDAELSAARDRRRRLHERQTQAETVIARPADGPPGGRAGAVAGRRASTRTHRARLAAGDRRELVRHLPHELRVRLAVAAAVERSGVIGPRDDAGGDLLDMTTLRALLTPIVRRTARTVLPEAAADVAVACRIARSGEEVTASGRAGGRSLEVFARAPLRWIADIWAPGFGQLDDRFALAVTTRHHRDEVEALTYRWQPSRTGSTTLVAERTLLRRCDGRWTVARAEVDA